MNHEEEKIRSAWRLVLRHAAARPALEDLRYYARRQSFVSDDPYGTAFREGERALAQRILDSLDDEGE